MAVLGDVAAARLRRSSNVVSRVVADEAIVVPIRRGVADLNSIYTFNETGTQIWSLIEKGLHSAEVVNHLQSEYGLSREQAVADAEAFLRELSEEGLAIQTRPTISPPRTQRFNIPPQCNCRRSKRTR